MSHHKVVTFLMLRQIKLILRIINFAIVILFFVVQLLMENGVSGVSGQSAVSLVELGEQHRELDSVTNLNQSTVEPCAEGKILSPNLAT